MAELIIIPFSSSSSSITCIFFFLLLLLHSTFISNASGELLCEDLPSDMCAFAVSTAGLRCVLEKKITIARELLPDTAGHRPGDNYHVELECQTSTVTAAPDVAEWVESEHCVRWCGLDRMWVGMSSDALVEQASAPTICSPACHNNCPNLIDLFSNIASGEGVSLAELCVDGRHGGSDGRRREMGEVSIFASLSSDVFDTSSAMAPFTSSSLDASAPSPSL